MSLLSRFGVKFIFETQYKRIFMARPKTLDNNVVVSARIETQMYSRLHDISALETMNTGRTVSVQELIRNAISFVYDDNERLRESFRRSRSHITKRFK